VLHKATIVTDALCCYCKSVSNKDDADGGFCCTSFTTVQECDARNDDWCYKAGFIKITRVVECLNFYGICYMYKKNDRISDRFLQYNFARCN